MPLGMVGRTGPGMRQVLGFGDPSRGMGNFEGKYGAHHCNQWGNFQFPILEIPTAPLLGWCDVTASTSTKKARVVLRAGLACRVASTPSNVGSYGTFPCYLLNKNKTRIYHVLKSVCARGDFGRFRSPEQQWLVAFNWQCVTSYCCSVMTLGLGRTVVEL